jgi:histone demethylase JARID1
LEKKQEGGGGGGGRTTATGSRLMTAENLERDYWNCVETGREQVRVEYGNDVDTDEFGSGFPLSERGRSIHGVADPAKVGLPEPEFGTPDYYKETWWNLNNTANAPDSVLRHVRVGINGINVPWMYYGGLFTTFCWHNEDNYLYSINYHHRGAPKLWYGVPGGKNASDGLEKVFKSYLSMKMRDVPDLLHHITTMFSPRLLQNADVPVYRTVQHEGEFVITFPRSFHGGFSLGPNIGEAVNFATHDWISYGADANERYRSYARPAVFSHDRLTFTMANHLEDQTKYSTCKLLLEELERVVQEELNLRQKLLGAGVRDVSDLINLPANRLDQLDEKSANYDEKRLCHSCKHVCFFSAVACQCSQSKVSCLRHSHFMCRCPTNRKYFMIWSTDEELRSTLARVRGHCDSLRTSGDVREEGVVKSEVVNEEPLPEIARGVARDEMHHKYDEISTEPVTAESFVHFVKKPIPAEVPEPVKRAEEKVPPRPRVVEQPESSARIVSAARTIDEAAFAHAEEEIDVVGFKSSDPPPPVQSIKDNDEVEILEVKKPAAPPSSASSDGEVEVLEVRQGASSREA